MRKSLVFAMVAVLACSSMALAGVPDPARSGCGTTGNSSSCIFKFYADGSLDVLTCCVTLRDNFDAPVVGCSTVVTVVADTSPTTPFGITGNFCKCGVTGNTFTDVGVSDSSGVVYFTCDDIGGFAELNLAITALCGTGGTVGICTKQVIYTSTDLDGSCEQLPAVSTNVIDLGFWTQGRAPGNPNGFSLESDYDCSGVTDVIDLGFWTQGRALGCP